MGGIVEREGGPKLPTEWTYLTVKVALSNRNTQIRKAITLFLWWFLIYIQ